MRYFPPHPRKKVARLPTLCDVWQVASDSMLVALAAGTRYGVHAGTRVSHRAILRHAVRVHDGKCLRQVCVLVLFA